MHMTLRTEDQVRDNARRALGLGTHDDNLDLAINGGSDVGQITTFNSLGFVGVPDKPDGWYLPKDTATPALILETKSPDKDLDQQKWVDELHKNLRIVETKYTKAVGILYNGTRVRVYLLRSGTIEEVTEGLSAKLEKKEYYLSKLDSNQIDKQHIFATTAKINNLLHHTFGVKDLTDRMIFTACALVAKRYGFVYSAGMDYHVFHQSILSTLTKELIKHKQQNAKLDALIDAFSAIRMNLNVSSEDEKEQERIAGLIAQFHGWVEEISEHLTSSAWHGEDVMGVFFNEFNRYKTKSEKGQVFTPDHITDFMYHLTGTTMNDNVLDAACGSGAFLTKAMGNMIAEAGGPDTAKAAKIKSDQLFGIEFDREVFALACANMLLHQDGKTNLDWNDSTTPSAGKWIADKPITKVLMNPPFEGRACLAIVQNVLDNVAPGTTAAFILPDKKLEKGTKTFQKHLKAHHRLEQVIKLPENLFFGVGVTTSIFVFTAGVPQGDEEFWACYFEQDGLETVKNKGRHDVRGTWPATMNEWLKAVKRRDHDTGQWHSVDECMSWQAPREPFSITYEDFFKTVLDYKAYTDGIDIKQLRETIADKVMFERGVGLCYANLDAPMHDEENE